MIYLDHNSTTLIDPRVLQAMSDCYAVGYANPASDHAAGRKARRALEAARDGIARILGVDRSTTHSAQIVFTSGGTEANNLALRGVVGRPPGRVIISAIEHPSVVGAAHHLQSLGFDVRLLGVTSDGVVETEKLARIIDDNTRVVSVMMGNHETGVLQPIEELARICDTRNVPLHTDAVQVVGKLPVSFDRSGVSLLSGSAHKFHGPRGIGILVVRHGTQLTPILHGGFQQRGLRPGTESVALAVGMHAALALWHEEATERTRHMERLRDRLQTRLFERDSAVVVNGATAPRLPHTLNISFPGLDRQALLMALDQEGICCSAGSACASGSSEPSPVLSAMGCPEPIVAGSLRLSLGMQTSEIEVDRAAEVLLRVASRLRRQTLTDSGLGSPRGPGPEPV
jgi:cysteine desulfurase